MAGPWEEYADPQASSAKGPWSDYQQPKDSGVMARVAAGAKAGVGLPENKSVGAGVMDTIKQLSGYNSWHSAINQWEQGNHAQAVETLLDLASKGPSGQVAEGVLNTSKDQAGKAKKALKEGRYGDALVHASTAVAVPLAPSADALEKAESGDTAGALAQVLTNVGSLAAPGMLEAKLGGRTATVIPRATTPEGAFAEAHGIPVPASVNTGDKFTSAVESHLANSLGSSGVMARAAEGTKMALADTGADLASQVGPESTPQSAGEAIQEAAASRQTALAEAKAAQDAALAEKGSQVAEAVHPTPATPETAGAGIAQTLQGTSKAQGQAASTAYQRLADIENAPENLKTVQIGTRENPELNKWAHALAGDDFKNLSAADQKKITDTLKSAGVDADVLPVTKDIPLPVDMRPVKTALRGIYDQIKQTMPIAQQQASRGLKAIENIINGDDYVSASTADTNLGAVKAIEREAPNDKTSFLARKAIDAFSPSVDEAISGAGQEAVEALQQGRALTRAKYATRDTFEQLPTEPVKIYRTLTAPGDTNIGLLRDVKAKAPGSIPAIGRAMVQGLMEDAGASGTAKAAAAWDKIGDATKLELLGSPDKVSMVDRYFKTAADLEASPVPAGMESPAPNVPGEPVSAYSRLVQQKDVAIKALTDAAQAYPDTIPKIARAKIDDLIQMATGGKAKTASSAWANMGDSTKEILYPDPVLRKQLDGFFSTAEKTAEAIDRNTSRTAYVTGAGKILGTLKDIALGSLHIGAIAVEPAINYGIAKLLTSPGGALKFTKALNLASKATITAAENVQLTALTNQLLRTAGLTQKQIEAVPAAVKTEAISEPAKEEPDSVPSQAPPVFQKGQVVNLKDVGPVKITNVHDDYTFDYEPVK